MLAAQVWRISGTRRGFFAEHFLCCLEVGHRPSSMSQMFLQHGYARDRKQPTAQYPAATEAFATELSSIQNLRAASR